MTTVRQLEKCNMMTLTGSAAIVREYLEYAMTNVLYQRGPFDSGNFELSKSYGLDLFKAKNQKLSEYFNRILGQIERFLANKEVASVELVLINKNTREYLERWKFTVDYGNESSSCGTKDKQVIQNEIKSVMKQINCAMTILPLLEEDKLTYQIQATPRPGFPMFEGWRRVTENTIINNKEKLSFRSFSTSIHGMESTVEYKKSL